MQLGKIITISSVSFALFYDIGLYISASDNSSVQSSLLSTVEVKSEEEMKQYDSRISSLLMDINNLAKANLYQDAEKKLIELKEIYGKVQSSKYIYLKYGSYEQLSSEFYRKWADNLEAQASAAYLDKKWDKSVALSKEAIEKLKKAGVKIPDEVKERNEKYIKTPELVQKQKDWDSQLEIKKIDPALDSTIKDKDAAFIKAQTYINNREFAKARDVLEQILLVDPYDYQAMYMLKNVYGEIYQAGKARAESDAINLAAQAAWKSNQPIRSDILNKQTVTVIESSPESKSKLSEKLDKIVIDKVDFDNASVSAIVTYLNKESKRLDRDDGTGINIVLKMDKENDEKNSKITMSLDDVPIGEVIKYLCSCAGLKYRIEEHAVIIGNDSINELKTEFFSIKSGLINSIVSNIKLKDVKSSDNDIWDSKAFGKEQLDTKLQEVTTGQLKEYFIARGVPFPEGAQIAWDVKTSMLIITNTPENIRIFTNLLKEIDIEIPLVLIETKFLEITETELEELAFKWKLQMTGSPTSINPTANDQIIRHYNYENESGGGNQYAVINDMTYSNQNGLGGQTTLKFWMYAIDQSQTMEVLSSPKVLTKSGSTAIIRMVKEEYFPTTWTTPTVSSSNNAIIVNTSNPTFGDSTDLGIVLKVTPTVSPNNYTIFLDLFPQVIDFIGWDDYQYNIIVTNVDTPYVEPLKMPQIAHRSVMTKAKIFDGETIVLGGIIKDETVSVNDTYPILGETPLVGRLFRSQYENTEKKNLLIFVSAKLVNPDGTPVHKDIKRGLEEYPYK